MIKKQHNEKKRFVTEHNDRRLDEEIVKHVKRLKMSKKEYVHACLQFFTSRQLNPVIYDPQNAVEFSDLLETSIASVNENIDTVNENLISVLWEEVKHSRRWLEALSSQITELMVEDEHKERVQKEIIEYTRNAN